MSKKRINKSKAGGAKGGGRNKKRNPAKKRLVKSNKGKPNVKLGELTKTEGTSPQSTTGIRLNKFVANAGVCSRRKADELIKNGEVTVNGKVVVEMGHKVQKGDVVEHNGEALAPKEKVYVLLNKPKDVITTTSDPQGRRTVMDLIKRASPHRLFPVGRLDRHTTGVLLLTNDGEMAQKLMHPSYEIRKIYHVILDKPLTKRDLERVKEGVTLEEGKVTVDDVAYANDRDRKEVGLEIHIGWNRVVRRTFEHLGYEVKKLDRVMYGTLTKKDVPRGKWRFLKDREIVLLKHFKS